MLSVRLPEELEARLSELAKKTGRSKSYYAKEAIARYIEDMEDYYLAVQALEEHYASGGRTFNADEVRKNLGLAD